MDKKWSQIGAGVLVALIIAVIFGVLVFIILAIIGKCADDEVLSLTTSNKSADEDPVVKFYKANKRLIAKNSGKYLDVDSIDMVYREFMAKAGKDVNSVIYSAADEILAYINSDRDLSNANNDASRVLRVYLVNMDRALESWFHAKKVVGDKVGGMDSRTERMLEDMHDYDHYDIFGPAMEGMTDKEKDYLTRELIDSTFTYNNQDAIDKNSRYLDAYTPFQDASMYDVLKAEGKIKPSTGNIMMDAKRLNDQILDIPLTDTMDDGCCDGNIDISDPRFFDTEAVHGVERDVTTIHDYRGRTSTLV